MSASSPSRCTSCSATSRTPALVASGGSLTGVKTSVPFGTVADAFLVSAVDGIYLVEADAAGVTVERQDAVDDIPDALVTFDGAAGTRIAGPEGLDSLLEHGRTGQCDASWRASPPAPSSSPPTTSRSASSSIARSPRSRPWPSAPPTPASTARPSSSPRWQAAMRIDDGLPAAEQAARPSTGRPRAASAWCTPRPTSTVVSASTATTRCTATTCGPRSRSCSSVAPPRACWRWASAWPTCRSAPTVRGLDTPIDRSGGTGRGRGSAGPGALHPAPAASGVATDGRRRPPAKRSLG